MNCRGSGTYAALGKHTLVATRSRDACHARTTDDGGRRTRRRRPEWKCGGFREAGQALVDSAVSSFVEHIRKRLVRGADHGTNSARGNSLGGAATLREFRSKYSSIELRSA
jgi:hypothetical protein